MIHKLVVQYYEPDDDDNEHVSYPVMLITDPEITDSLIKIINGFIGDEAIDIYNILRYGKQKVAIMEHDELSVNRKE